MLICQSFYLLYYALNWGRKESCEKTLFNFAYFVNILAILLHNFSLHF